GETRGPRRGARARSDHRTRRRVRLRARMLLADSVGLALQIVLDTLPPAERLLFVLHDMFDVPFDEIAAMVGRSSAAARQLAAVRGVASKVLRSRRLTLIWPVSDGSSMLSSRRRAGATSVRSSGYWIPTSCCDPMAASDVRRVRSCAAARP